MIKEPKKNARSTKTLLRLRVNGETREVATEINKTLLEVLREDLNLTGTKHGCELGECGTCAVLVAGKPVLSCLMLGIEAEHAEILTIEGIMRDGKPHPLQNAFADLGAAQCGYCIPGIVLTAKALLDENPTPTPEEIRQSLSGNLCRCTGYTKIIEAVELAAKKMAANVGVPS
ncbi:MAG TPA: (2Fe-2S)-binding protein [Candidatus Binatia bacterium]|nr:(2Fe-2S)-binding protein [Candidatus Binatia bacterium]